MYRWRPQAGLLARFVADPTATSQDSTGSILMRALLAIAASLAFLSPAQAQDIGVPACDKMLKTYETCVMAKSPAQAQAQMKATFEQMRANWKAVAASADGKKSLEPVCVQTTEQMKSQLASFNCAW